MKRLTDVNFWEQSWWKRERPRRLWLYRDFDFETVRLLGSAGRLLRVAAGAKPPRVLEIGAGGSRVLPYLGRKFGYGIFGSDFSLSGCQLLRANLALQSVGGGVVCEDLFQSSLPAETFDLVYSSGLIEHFDDTPAAMAEHVRLLRPGGKLVLIVPNFQGIQGRIMQRLAPGLRDVHRIFGPDDLSVWLRALGLEHVHSAYLGSFFIHVGRDPQWSAVMTWPRWFQHSAHWSVRVINGLISLFFRLSPLRPHSRALSPAFFAAGIRPAGNKPPATAASFCTRSVD